MFSYTLLTSEPIHCETLRVLNEFERYFGNSTIHKRGDWQSRLLLEYALVDDVQSRDVIFARTEYEYAGLQQFCTKDSFAYAEGLYVKPTFRGHGLGKAIREELFAHLRFQGITRFYIGKEGEGCAYGIRRDSDAQGLARSDLGKHKCIDIVVRPGGTIKSYGILL